MTLLCDKYAVSESAVAFLLSKMSKRTFANQEVIVDAHHAKQNYYIISSGIWRAFRLEDTTEITLWFERYGDVMYSEVFTNYCIESVGVSEAYVIPKTELDRLCLESHEISNLIRIIVEKFYFDVTHSSVDLSSQMAKERYLAMLEKDPELFQLVPQKYIASFLGLTPQSLSRIRKDIFSKLIDIVG